MSIAPTTCHKPSLAPPTKWRNKWRANVRLVIICGCHPRRLVQPDETFLTCCVWPSYDIAESDARERMRVELAQHGYPLAEWINAIKDD